MTISNTGAAGSSLSITAITKTGADTSQFQVSPAVLPTLTIKAGDSTRVTVTFAPTYAGTKSASLSIAHNALSSPAAVTLTGTGVGVPAIRVSPSPLAIDNTNVGATSQNSVTITNIGSATLSISGITVGGTDAGQFKASPTTATIAPDGNQVITVTFAPSSAGVKSASLSIVHNAAGTPSTVALSGTGVAPGPSPGPQPPTAGGGTPSISVPSVSAAPGATAIAVSIETSDAAGIAAASFTLTYDPSALTAKEVKNAALTYKFRVISNLNTPGEVRFNLSKPEAIPSGKGALATIVFDVKPDAKPGDYKLELTRATLLDQQVKDIPVQSKSPGAFTVKGTTQPPSEPKISVSGAPLSFGNVQVGQSKALTFTVGNSGDAPLKVSGIAASGANAGEFTVDPGAKTFTVNAGATPQTVTVTFKPSSAGTKTATLTLSHNAAGGSSTVEVSGTGVLQPTPGISLSPASLTFAATEVGKVSSQTVTITNTGDAILSITGVSLGGGDPDQFALALASDSDKVAPGGSLTLRVTFRPSSEGIKTATLTLSHSAAGSPSTVALNGRGGSQPPPEPKISVSPTSLVFDNTKVGSSSDKTLTITNTGDAGLSVTRIAVEGTDRDQFKVSPASGNVEAGRSLTVTVTFAPSSSGAKSATLSIAHNAAGTPSAVALSGTGASVTVVSGTPSPKAGDGTGTLGVTDQTTRTLGSVKSGQKVDVLISLSQEVAGATGFQVTLTFDPKRLSVVSGKAEGIFASAITLPAQSNSGTATYGGAFLGQSATARGPVAVVTFLVADDFSGDVEVTLTGLTIRVGSTLRDFKPGASVVLSSGAGSGGLASDFDGNGTVDFDDFFSFASAFGTKRGQANFDAKFDLSGNGAVDFDDFFSFAGDFGETSRSGKVTTSRPGVNARANVSVTAVASKREMTAQVSASNVAQMRGYALNVSYDPSALAFVQAERAADALLSRGGSTPLFLARETVPGRVIVADAAVGGTASGDGALTDLVFRRIGTGGDATVRVDVAQVFDGSGRMNFLDAKAEELTSTYALSQNSPNPFNPATQIAYELPEAGEVRLAIYNALGQEVRALVQGRQEAGYYRVAWDGRDAAGRPVSSGLYFYRLMGSGFSETRKMMLLK